MAWLEPEADAQALMDIACDFGVELEQAVVLEL